MQEFTDFNNLPPMELDLLAKLFSAYSMFHESVEDFVGRMEFDNGLDWMEKFTTL